MRSRHLEAAEEKDKEEEQEEEEEEEEEEVQHAFVALMHSNCCIWAEPRMCTSFNKSNVTNLVIKLSVNLLIENMITEAANYKCAT